MQRPTTEASNTFISADASSGEESSKKANVVNT